MASALSIQSPFLSFLQCDSDTITRRRPMMSNHGDPFTLLNVFDEWINVRRKKIIYFNFDFFFLR